MSVSISVRLSAFRFGIRSRKPMGDFSYIAHTHPLGGQMCLCGFMTFGRPSATINLNMPYIYQAMPDKKTFTVKQNVRFQVGIFPCSTKLGRRVMASPRMYTRSPVRILFPEQILETHGGISFILHTFIP